VVKDIAIAKVNIHTTVNDTAATLPWGHSTSSISSCPGKDSPRSGTGFYYEKLPSARADSRTGKPNISDF
jgi:hypothetical protein